MGNIIAVIAIIKDAKDKAENGVIYTSRNGAACPSCGKRLTVVTTRPWEETERVRFHRCTNNQCVLMHMHTSIKSVETDEEAKETA